MRERGWLLLALYGFLLTTAVSGALKATRPKFKIATTSTTTTTGEPAAEESENEEVEPTTVSPETNGTTGHTLTGIPQIDYIWDPNLPRELNGYNLSDYPFYNSIPEDLDFKCDGLHDGFYASVPHKCQVYHHCLYGTRYDFLCANFTAFDQKTFICHFVSEVDCVNSKNYWHRNDALYKAATTTTTSTTTTTTTAAPVTVPPTRSGPRRRRPLRRRPAYDYYDEDYYDDDFDRSRSRGYDRRDDYEYEDRKYRRDRDRDRDFQERDRDYRDPARTRDAGRPLSYDRDREREMSPRERFPVRSNRRDILRGGKEPAEEEPVATRKKEQTEDADIEDRRYADKRYKDEYDEEDPAAPAAAASTEGLVKPAAPSTSVYARPRAPPKIRRPVPLSEQDKYAYKATSTQTSAEEPRRRPVDLIEDDYYEDDLEEIRPRRPMRRRPAYREREREFYESRETRDRDRDRPFRSRYQEEDDDVPLRKHPERSRDRLHERERERDRGIDRGRDRSLDRGKERTLGRERDRAGGKSQDPERPERPSVLARVPDRERENDRSRAKDSLDGGEPTRRPSIYDRSTEKSSTVGTARAKPVEEAGAEEASAGRPQNLNNGRSALQRQEVSTSSQDHSDKSSGSAQRSDADVPEDPISEEYPFEYYDELEDLPVSSPRTTVRIVKRPFLPSRGGNPNPRGLLPVGSRAMGSGRRDEDRSVGRAGPIEGSKAYNECSEDEAEDEERKATGLKERNGEPKRTSAEVKTPYDAYKAIQTDILQKQRPEESDATAVEEEEEGELSRPQTEASSDPTRGRNGRPSTGEGPQQEKSIVEDSREQRQRQRTDENVATSSGSPNRGKVRYPATEASFYSSTYRNDDVLNQPTGPASLRAKQRLNEVTHRLQDIPESEFDVTLNEALTPTLNQESNLPSGFVLPLHRPLGRDATLQSSENNYQFSRPLNGQQQEKPFVPSPQFIPVAVNERPRTVYYRTPETIQISGTRYRQQRGPWQDYTGY